MLLQSKIITVIVGLVVVGTAGSVVSHTLRQRRVESVVSLSSTSSVAAVEINRRGPVTNGKSELTEDCTEYSPVFVFPGAAITSTEYAERVPGIPGVVVMYTTPKSAEAVMDFYKSELTARGWTFELIMNPAGYAAGYSGLGGTSNCVISISIAPVESQTSVRLGLVNAAGVDCC